MHVVVEGRDVTDPTATLGVDCGMQVQVDVTDEETGASVYTGTMFAGGVHMFPGLRVGEPNLLQIRLQKTDPGPGWGFPCSVTTHSLRHWRGPVIPLGAEFDMLMIHAAQFDSEMMMLDFEIGTARSTMDPDTQVVLDELERIVTEVTIDSGRWRSLPDHIDQDDLELIQLTNLRVLDPVLIALASSPQLARRELPNAAMIVERIRVENQTGVGIIGP
jgi:hypothetical protein